MAEQSNVNWQYLLNQFKTALTGSYSLTNIVIKDHRTRLQVGNTDTDIAALLKRTAPIHDDFSNKYASWEKSVAFWKGATNAIDRKLDEMSSVKIPRWDIQIQIEFPDTTSQYITLFPRGRTGFREGSKDDRLNALKTLVSSLAEYPVLEHIHTDAKKYYEEVEKLRFEQQQREKQVRDAASSSRTAQEEVFLILYRNLGALMDKYYRNTALVLNYYQVELIRDTKKMKENNTEEANFIEAIEPIIEE